MAIRSSRLSNWAPHLCLATVLMVALLVRLWGIGFGLPYANHPDESRFVMTAVRILQTGDFNPGWFQQPSLYGYVLSGALLLYFFAGASRGVFASVQDLFQPPYHFWGRIPYPGEFLVARTVTALIGVAGIWLVYELGRRLSNRWVGIAAAILLAFSYHHVSSSHFITTDVPCTTLVLASAIFAWLAWKQGRMRWYGLAGLTAGLSVSVKYSVFPILIPLFLAHYFRWRDGETIAISQELIAGLLAFPLGFLVGTPYALLDLPRFADGLAYEMRHHRYLGHPGAEGQAGWWFISHLMSGPERWLTASGVLGLLLGFTAGARRMLFLLAFPLPYYLLMSLNRVRFERFLVPLMPFLALGAAILFCELLPSWLPPKRRKSWLVGAIVLLLCVEPIMAVIRYDKLLASEDVRIRAARWIEENLPAGTKLAVERFGPPLSEEQYVLIEPYYMIDHDLQWYVDRGITHFAFGDISYQRFLDNPARYPEQAAQYQSLFDSLEQVRDFSGPYVGWPDHHVLLYRLNDQ